ncbi:hypothetical protein ABPG74_020889 [Tetrahymena malaccensis]
MSKIYESLYLGNQKVSQNLLFFEKNKIQNVLIVASGLKRSFKQKNYLQINVSDNEDELIMKYWPTCIQFLERSQGNTLVHCLGGVSRSASTVMAYAMFKENLTSEKSIKKISKLHIDSNPNTGFLKQLEFWDEILFAYRQQIAFGQNENLDLLQSITDKFIDVQYKRIAYHIRICMENKKSRRSKRSLIEESIENNPIDSVKSEIKCIGNSTKKQYIQKQQEYEDEMCEDLEDQKYNQQDENDDYEYVYEDRQTNNQDQFTTNYDKQKLNQEENESYEFCYQNEEIQLQLQQIEQISKEKAKRERKFNRMVEQLENECKNQQKVDSNKTEENSSSQNSNEEWFYSNVKLVSKKKNKKQSANVY